MELVEYINRRLVHEIHTSEVKSFRACRLRWNWIFRNSYYPTMTAKPLEFGVAYHEAMEVYYDPNKKQWPLPVRAELAKVAFVEKCESQKAKATEASPFKELDVSQIEDYQERVDLGLGMLDYYFTQVAPATDEGWEAVQVEVEFMVPIPHPDTKEPLFCTCDQCWKNWTKNHPELSDLSQVASVTKRSQWSGLPVVWAGRLDVLALDEEGYYWIIDWKTAAQLRDDWFFLELDDQIESYVWAMHVLGIPVRGFVYHAQRKGFPHPPKENSTRRNGCLFSVNKAQDTDYDTYLNTVMTYDLDAYLLGLYDDMLYYLAVEGVKYFERRQVHKTDEQMLDIEHELGMMALDIIDENIRIYRSPGRFGCNTCAFQGPCVEKHRGGDYKYLLDHSGLFERRAHYYLRQEPSTESKGGE